MPKPSAPTLSPATAQFTENAIKTYDDIVARGGWPEVPKVDELRLGNRHPSVADLRARLTVSGDLDPNAVGNDIYNSYVEAAVRRFQVRHGLTSTASCTRPLCSDQRSGGSARAAQVNIVRLKALTGNLGNRFVVANIPAAQIEAIENGVAVTRHTAVAGKPDRPSPDLTYQDHPDQLQPVLDRAGIDHPQGFDSEDAGRAGLSLQESHPHLRSRNNELQPSQIDWYSDEAVNYKFKQDPGISIRSDRSRSIFPAGRRLHARHAVEESVRRGFPLRLLRLHAGAECARARLLASGGNAGLVADRDRRGDQIRRAQDAQLAKPVPLYWVYVTAWAAPTASCNSARTSTTATACPARRRRRRTSRGLTRCRQGLELAFVLLPATNARRGGINVS